MDCVRAVALGSLVTILVIVLAFRFEGFSRMVFVFDGVYLLMLLCASRFSFRLLRRLTPVPHAATGRRVIIYGAGDGGELLLRELNNNAALQYVPVAFIDDDPMKAGRHLHGLPIYSGAAPLTDICRSTRAQELLLSSLKLPLSRVREIIAQCESCGVPVKMMKIEIQRIADGDIGWVVPSPDAEDAKTTLASLPLGTPLLTAPPKLYPQTEH
jgi:UDP-GlcNAc:undecaprenyl-phosphate GlcNAc-1-phosphate transferase